MLPVRDGTPTARDSVEIDAPEIDFDSKVVHPNNGIEVVEPVSESEVGERDGGHLGGRVREDERSDEGEGRGHGAVLSPGEAILA